MNNVTHLNPRGKKMRAGAATKQAMRAGACPPAGACPAGARTIADIANARGAVVAGEIGTCKWSMLPLVATMGAGETEITITEPNSPIGLCVNRIVAIVEGTPVQFHDLTFGNDNQWITGQLYDQFMFRPDGRCSACCLPMDCFKQSTVVTLGVTRIPDAAADAAIDVYFYLIGPAIGI